MAEPVGQDQNQHINHLLDDPNEVDNDEWENVKGPRVRNKKKRTLQDSSDVENCGVCYLSRVPPHMGPSNLRQILSKYGDIERLYLSPEDPTAQVRRKQAGGFRGKQFSEGWVEFTKKSVAKKVANMLNGEQIGGKRKSSFYYDILNIKYLSKFKWDDLTSEIANRNHTREQKLAMEISAAKRQRDFYMTKVDQSRALKFMRERASKNQKTSGDGGDQAEEPKIIRRFPQNRAVVDNAVESKPMLSFQVLSGVFGRSS